MTIDQVVIFTILKEWGVSPSCTDALREIQFMMKFQSMMAKNVCIAPDTIAHLRLELVLTWKGEHERLQAVPQSPQGLLSKDYSTLCLISQE
jgi:hypothetical protein